MYDVTHDGEPSIMQGCHWLMPTRAGADGCAQVRGDGCGIECSQFEQIPVGLGEVVTPDGGSPGRVGVNPLQVREEIDRERATVRPSQCARETGE